MISTILYSAFMLHGLTAEEPDAQSILADFKKNSMDRYKDLADGLLTGWALDAQQQFNIGDEVKLKRDKDDKGRVQAYATCQANAQLKLLHAFDSVNFVPIGNTPYEAEQVVSGWAQMTGTKPQKFSGTLDANGMGQIMGCQPNSQYRIRFFPNVGQGEIDALYASYDGVIDKLHTWLQDEWNGTISQQWRTLAPVNDPRRLAQISESFMKGMGNALMSLWDDIKHLFHILTHLDEYYDKLIKFISETDFQKLKAQAKELMQRILLIVSDEPLMFLYASAVVCWVQLLPPTTVAEIIAQFATGLLLDILLGIVLSGGAGLAVRLTVKATKAVGSGAAAMLEKALQALINASSNHALSAHANKVKPLAARGEVLVNSSKKATVEINSPAQGISQIEPDTLSVKRNKTQNTQVTQAADVDDASAQAKTPNDKPADKAENTCTKDCPVSMVTGEELLTLTDGELDGLLAFPWSRLYRTSAAEIDHGLGFGWSHSLAHRLNREGEELVWVDHENRSTRFPMPSAQRPAITNRLSRAAIYLGDDPAELILALASKTPRFYHFRRDAQGGYLIGISDAYGNRLDVSRDLAGRIQRLSNKAGRALKLQYEGKHIAAVHYQIQRPADNEEDSWHTIETLARYRYNAAGQLLEASNALGETERYRYDEANVILERQLAGGATFYWEWQGNGKQARCVHHWANFGQMDARYHWDDKGGVTIVNADGSEEVYVHDDNARLIKQVDPDGAQTLKSYDDKGQLIAEQDALGAITEYRYDEAGRLTAVIPPEDQPIAYEYRYGFVSAVRRGEAIWQYRRNAQGDITAQTDPHGHTTRYSYDAQGRLLAINHPDGSQHKLTWNPLGQLIEEQLPSGGERRYRYDALGRQITRQDESGAISHYQWDAVGRLTQITLPGGGTRAFTYNAYGKVTSERDELGRVTRYEYADGLHLVSRRINPDGSQLRYRYDNARLLLTEIENERGEHYHLSYYPNGLIQREIAFDGRSTAYAYDLNGHLIEKKEFGDDGSERVTTYQRDAAGRLLVKTLADGEQVHYAYDALGRLVSVEDGQWPLAYRYDLQDRLIEEHQGWATLRYEYDALGQLSHCRLPDGSQLDYRHQRGGTLAAIDLNGQPLTAHQYTPGGREQYRQQGALLSEYQYDEQGRLRAHSLRQEQQRVLQRHYRYDANGNLAGIDDSRKGSKSFHYDPLDRLVAVRGDTPESFVHDPAGTLLAQSGSSSGLANVKGNRLLMQGDRHFDYDAFGNLIRERRGAGHRLITEYRYDSQHRLIGANLPDGSQVSYRYDAFGRRIAKVVAGKTTEFLWQGERLIAESSPEHYRSYVYEPGTFRPLAMLQGQGAQARPYYYQLDHLGTPQELTSAAGEILWSVKYRAYGNVAKLEIADIDNPLRFQGQYYDAETGLHYNRHRYYNPNTGSYLTPDPIKLAGGLNNYQYVNNPTGWVDPLGLSGVKGDCPGTKSDSLFDRYPDKTVIQTKGIDEQATFLSENIPGLPEAQAKTILEESHAKGSSAVFGGSRVRGNHTPESDLDVGFGGLNANQAAKLIKKLEKMFNLEPSFLKLEKTRIVPGNETNSIKKIESPEEFFQRSGTRSDADPKAGEPYFPSGSVTANPDGTIVIIPPGANQ